MRRLLPLTIAAVLLAAPVQAEAPAGDEAAFAAPAVSDDDLAASTGKFTLPNGVELAMSVTSDTVVNGALVLRTVFTVDTAAHLIVFGRDSTSDGLGYPTTTGTGAQPSGITISLDRQSGIQTITPIYPAVTTGGVTVGSSDASADPLGLSVLPVVPGGPAVQTVDGVVAVRTLANGSLVTLAGDRLSVADLVGQSVATAISNSGNDRTLDTVTNVTIDLRNVQPFLLGSAALRVDALALEATRGTIR